jgi:hypothetical protein
VLAATQDSGLVLSLKVTVDFRYHQPKKKEQKAIAPAHGNFILFFECSS